MEQHFPNLPSQVPQRGNALSRALFKKLFLAQGWTIEGEVPNFPKAVAIIFPTPPILMAGMVFLPFLDSVSKLRC